MPKAVQSTANAAWDGDLIHGKGSFSLGSGVTGALPITWAGRTERTPGSTSPEELLALASVDLKTAYGWKFAACVERVEITLRGHAMAAPLPGFRANAGLKALRELDGPILFAHADLSGFSVFEEAAWWGYRAAQLAVV